jgi:DNA-binding transcriptional LysR family regulator
MEIRVLRYFLTVAREENITKAAEVLHITQPTLSRQLTALEEETGVKLFYRGSRKITLTNEGLLLRRRAEEIVELAEKTAQELTEQGDQIEGTIVIGAGELAAVQNLIRLCGSFQKKYPLVRFEFYTANADQVRERMERGLIDVGLLLEPVDMERFEFIRVDACEEWVVLMRPDSPLAEKEAVTAEDLTGVPLILPSRMQIQSELANWFGDTFKNLDVRYTGNLTANVAMIVQCGQGYAIVIGGAVPFWDQERIVSRPLSPALRANSAFAWRRNQPYSRATEKFIEHLKNSRNMGDV